MVDGSPRCVIRAQLCFARVGGIASVGDADMARIQAAVRSMMEGLDGVAGLDADRLSSR